MIDYTSMDMDQLKGLRESATEEKKAYAEIEKNINDEILRRKGDELAAALRDKDEPFGTIQLDGIKFTVPKKVDWDQAALASLYNEIGETAHEYMDVSYKVKEAAFKNWPSSIQEAFIPARTVKPGAIKIEFTEE